MNQEYFRLASIFLTKRNEGHSEVDFFPFFPVRSSFPSGKSSFRWGGVANSADLRIGLSESEAKARGIAYRLAKIPMAAVLRTRTLSETRGFMKALIEPKSDRILGFTAFGVEAGEVMAAVQLAIAAGLPYTTLRDSILTHPTIAEGLVPLFSSVPPVKA